MCAPGSWNLHERGLIGNKEKQREADRVQFESLAMVKVTFSKGSVN